MKKAETKNLSTNNSKPQGIYLHQFKQVTVATSRRTFFNRNNFFAYRQCYVPEEIQCHNKSHIQE